MKVGQVVYVFDARNWAIARVIGVGPRRLEVEYAGGERRVVGDRRVARTSAQSAPTAAALDAYASEVATIRGALELPALWELLSENGEHCVPLGDLAALALGVHSHAGEDALAWALFEDSIYFRAGAAGEIEVQPAERVEARLEALASERRAREEHEAMVAWLLDLDGPRPPGHERMTAALEALILDDDESKPCRLARRAIRTAYPADSEADPSIAFRVLCRVGVFGEHENLALRRARLARSFPGDVEVAAQAATVEPSTIRRDRTGRRAWAIDDPGTTEVDDALAVEPQEDGGWCVHVFVADAAAWIRAGDPLDVEARRRVATVYVPDGKLPMLPESLGQGAASLLPGEDRPAIDFVVTLSPEGRVVGFEIEEASIRVAGQLTYAAVDAVLGGAPHPAADDLHHLHRAASSLRAARRESGALILDRHEAAVVAEPAGAVQVVPYHTGDPSRWLVSEWMIAVCGLTARWCSERGVPALYRTQAAPDPRPVVPADRFLTPAELQRVLRGMRRAELKLTPEPHAGLGLDCYTQVTSPLRRYADLLMHRQIRAVLRMGQAAFGPGEFGSLLPHLEQAQALHGQVERESRRYWLLQWLTEKKGTVVEVEVLREVGQRWLVQLVGLPVQTAWGTSRPVKAGDRLNLKIREVSPRKGRLVLG